MILTGLTACDNVSWGGVEIRLQEPAATDTVQVEAVPEVEEALPPLDLPAALYLVERDGDSARLLPVALLGPSGPREFPEPGAFQDFFERFVRERMPAGRRFTLYAEGARVGTFYAGDRASGAAAAASSPDGEAAWCTPRPSVPGRIEIVPEAVQEERLLALPEDLGEAPGRSSGYTPRSSTRDQRVGALNAASALFVTREIRWPPSVLESREDMQVFLPAGSPEELIVATFLYGDSLGVGPAPPNAYSLFFIGEPGAAGRYETTYVRYREVGSDGKSAPRFVGHLDWDDDGRDEILLEVFGETGRSFAALTRVEAGWREIFEERCGDESGGAAASAESRPGRRRPSAGSLAGSTSPSRR